MAPKIAAMRKSQRYRIRRFTWKTTPEIEKALTKPAVRRLARRVGVKRIGALVYSEIRDVMHAFVRKTVHDAAVYTEYRHAKTVTACDVVHALKKNGRTLYGFT